MRSFEMNISLDRPLIETWQKISEVREWWTTDFSGKAREVGDEFIIHHPGAHYARHRVMISVPGEQLVWLVTESELAWIKKKDEWTGTRMVFTLKPGSLHFSHDGLTPDLQSYDRCSAGWTEVISGKLFNYVNVGSYL